jgi:hypothetical protein
MLKFYQIMVILPTNLGLLPQIQNPPPRFWRISKPSDTSLRQKAENPQTI